MSKRNPTPEELLTAPSNRASKRTNWFNKLPKESKEYFIKCLDLWESGEIRIPIGEVSERIHDRIKPACKPEEIAKWIARGRRQ
jgi:hypothetical protein